MYVTTSTANYFYIQISTVIHKPHKPVAKCYILENFCYSRTLLEWIKRLNTACTSCNELAKVKTPFYSDNDRKFMDSNHNIVVLSLIKIT